MKTLKDKLKVGKVKFDDKVITINKTVEYDYQVTESEEEAKAVAAKHEEWTLKSFVDEALKANARSNAYQNTVAPYRPSKRDENDIIESMVRDMIRVGVPEDFARQTVKASIEAGRKAKAESEKAEPEEEVA